VKALARANAIMYVFILSALAMLSVFATGKLENISSPGSANMASALLTKCLAPFATVFTNTAVEKQPFCNAEEFKGLNSEELLKLGPHQISALPSRYFESLRVDQLSELSVQFIGQLGKEQAMAFSKEAIDALPANSRKLLQKIKTRPGPMARAVIMLLSAFTAFIIFKYS
jgi:hypothetical protein